MSETSQSESKPAYFTGLDLGQFVDPTALAVVERTILPDLDDPNKTVKHFAVRHLHRFPLGTTYPAIVNDVRAMFTDEPLKGSALVIDATGVGRPVVDLFRAAGISASLRPITITSGENGGNWGCAPKKNLVAAVQVPLQARRLKIAESLPLAEVLAKELEMFRCKVMVSRNESFES